MPPFVSIVICTKNRQDALETYALPSVQKLNDPNFEVVVVDDASSDGTQQFLRDDQPGAIRLRVVRNQRSRGLCHARNVGLSCCGGEFIAFIDDDCAVTPEWLNGLVSAYNDDRIAMHGVAICRFDHLFSSDFDSILALNIPTMLMKPI